MSLAFLSDVLVFATKSHGKQVRQGDGNPYILHPIRVANHLIKIGEISNENIIAAAYLHDVVEDCGVELSEIEEKFGSIVTLYVGEVTDNKKKTKVERKKLQIEHAPYMSTGAKLVKLADKLDNLTDLRITPPKTWTKERVQGYFVWAKQVVSGLRGTNKALEDELDKIFGSNMTFQGKDIACIPAGQDEKVLLNEYYKLLEEL